MLLIKQGRWLSFATPSILEGPAALFMVLLLNPSAERRGIQ